MNELIMLFQNIDAFYSILFLFIVIVIIWLYKSNKDILNKINISDVVLDSNSEKLSSSKLFRFITFIVTTWGFVYLIHYGQLQEWYGIAYMGIWTGNALLRNYFSNKHND